jgi:hypothetical protein
MTSPSLNLNIEPDDENRTTWVGDEGVDQQEPATQLGSETVPIQHKPTL